LSPSSDSGINFAPIFKEDLEPFYIMLINEDKGEFYPNYYLPGIKDSENDQIAIEFEDYDDRYFRFRSGRHD
jgi:hypothetical protein